MAPTHPALDSFARSVHSLGGRVEETSDALIVHVPWAERNAVASGALGYGDTPAVRLGSGLAVSRARFLGVDPVGHPLGFEVYRTAMIRLTPEAGGE